MKVSVIMTAHNSAATIERALRSVLHQSEHSLELVVVDDSSTDSTADIVREVKHDHTWHWLKLRKTPHNVGCGGARAYGLTFATGDYVTFLDSDDWYDEDHVARMLDVAERTQADVVHCPLLFMRADGADNLHSTVDTETEVSGEALEQHLGDHWLTSFNCMLIRREHMARVEYSSLRMLDDRVSGMRLMLLGGKHVLLPKDCGVKYNYVVRGDSVFGSRSANIALYDAYAWLTIAREVYNTKGGVMPGTVALYTLRALPAFLNAYSNNKQAWDTIIASECPDMWERVAKFGSSLCVNLIKQHEEIPGHGRCAET